MGIPNGNLQKVKKLWKEFWMERRKWRKNLEGSFDGKPKMVKKLGRKTRWESYERKKKTTRTKDGVFLAGKKRWKFFFVDGNFLSLTHCDEWSTYYLKPLSM